MPGGNPVLTCAHSVHKHAPGCMASSHALAWHPLPCAAGRSMRPCLPATSAGAARRRRRPSTHGTRRTGELGAHMHCIRASSMFGWSWMRQEQHANGPPLQLALDTCLLFQPNFTTMPPCHSCGERCERPAQGCGHPCMLLCHPGECRRQPCAASMCSHTTACKPTRQACKSIARAA